MIQLFSSDSDLSFGASLVGFGQGKGFLLSKDTLLVNFDRFRLMSPLETTIFDFYNMKL